VVEPSRMLNAALAGISIGAPTLALAELSTPMLILRPPRYRELEVAFRSRRPLVAAGMLAAIGLVAQAARGRAPRRLAGSVAAGMAGLRMAAPAVYDPWLFAPRQHPVRIRPAPAAREVLGADTEVIGVRVNGQVRAYPARMLARPHLLTDTLGGEPIVVSYCGLTNSAIAYRAAGPTSPIRMSVLSAPRNNILYRQDATGGLVQQLLPQIAHGPGSGQPVATVPVVYTTWSTWQKLAPDTTLADSRFESVWDQLVTALMRREHLRSRARARTLLAAGEVDERLPRKTQLFALVESGAACAYTRRFLRSERVVNDAVGGEPVVVFYEPSTDVAMAYRRRTDDRVRNFRPVSTSSDPTAALASDVDTGSTWSVLGRCVHGPLAGHQLQPVVFSFDRPFWFAWAAYHPETRLRAAPGELQL
jgi:hypothetical protein